MSALLSKADIDQLCRDFRFGPFSDAGRPYSLLVGLTAPNIVGRTPAEFLSPIRWQHW
jgi:hypothetical protein